MKKWEYLCVSVYWTKQGIIANKVTDIFLNGVVFFKDDRNPIYLRDYFNRLGKDGWELINADGNSFYLKRPLEE